MPQLKPVDDPDERKLLIEQTRKAAAFYRRRMEERGTAIIALDTEETVIVVAIGKARDDLVRCITAEGIATVQRDTGEKL